MLSRMAAATNLRPEGVLHLPMRTIGRTAFKAPTTTKVAMNVRLVVPVAQDAFGRRAIATANAAAARTPRTTATADRVHTLAVTAEA
jgi:hypothetical protein